MKRKLLSMTLAASTAFMMLAAAGGATVVMASEAEEEETADEAEETPLYESNLPDSDANYDMDITDNGDGTLTVIDMAGREVVIPDDVQSVYCAVPTGEAMVCTLFPDKLVGWVNEPTEEEMEYLGEDLSDLPVIGGWMGQVVTANMEDIITLDPDVVIYMRSNAQIAEDDVPEQIAEQTGLPVLVVSSELADTSYVYRFLGRALNSEERGDMLADYVDQALEDLSAQLAEIPDDEIKTVYYAENEDGLYTEPASSTHAEVMAFCRTDNIADVEELSGQGYTPVSIEQIITWNPDVILVCGSDADDYDQIMDPDGIWTDITAVQNGEVYVNPVLPFNWVDRPPNVMRVLGVYWFANEVYPDYVDYDINEVTKDFFSTFFNNDLTDEQVENLLTTKSSE